MCPRGHQPKTQRKGMPSDVGLGMVVVCAFVSLFGTSFPRFCATPLFLAGTMRRVKYAGGEEGAFEVLDVAR